MPIVFDFSKDTFDSTIEMNDLANKEIRDYSIESKYYDGSLNRMFYRIRTHEHSYTFRYSASQIKINGKFLDEMFSLKDLSKS